MKKLVLLCGGDSVENEISVLTMLKVKSEFDRNKWKYEIVYLSRTGEFLHLKRFSQLTDLKKKKYKKVEFKKSGTNTYFQSGSRKYYFAIVLPLVHGKGVEDGTLKAYFDTLKIPAIGASILSSALIQDKGYFKDLAKFYKIPQTNYLRVALGDDLTKLTKKIALPLIVKPVHLGSSIGIKKVESDVELFEAISYAFTLDSEVVVEEVVSPLIEYNIAVVRNEEKLLVSAIEEVNDFNKVLSYEAKYIMKSPEYVTRKIPARVDEELRLEIETLARKVYEKFQCESVIRFDFLYNKEKKKLYFNEGNSIPGSLAYYLFEKSGITFRALLEIIVENGINSSVSEQNLVTSTNEKLLELLSNSLGGGKKI